MRSKNWSCNLSRPVIRKDFTRFWPVWGSYLAIWLLMLPIPLLTSGFYHTEYATMVSDIQGFILDMSGVPAVVMSAIYGGLSAFAVWSYLYQGRSASLFHALPVTRSTLFCSHVTAGLGFMVLPNVLIALLAWVAQTSLGYADPRHLLCWLAVSCLEGLLFFAIGTLAAHMTGNLPAMPVLYGLLNFAVVVCETLLNEYATMIYYGITSLRFRFTALSPFIHLVNQDVALRYYVTGPDGGYTYSSEYFNPDYFKMLILYALAAVVMIAAALLLYRKRATESAGDVIAISWLRPVAKYVFSFGCALTLGWLLLEVVFSGSEVPIIILFCLMFAGTVGYLTASMLLKKSFRVFTRKQLAGLPALWIVLALIICCFRFDLLGTERYIPDEGDIVSADLTAQYSVTGDQQNLGTLRAITDLHRDIIGQLDVLEARQGPYDQQVYLRFNYELRSGRTVSRRYPVPYSEALAADPTTLAGKAAVLLDDPNIILADCLPPDDAVIESLSLHFGEGLAAYAGQYLYESRYVDTAHIPVLRQALKEDILAGRLARWQRDTSEMLCGFEFSYDMNEKIYINLNPNSSSIAKGDYITKEASHWASVYLYKEDTPTATLEALYRLGYLTEVPHE
ncbi:MAG: ABC transporter permease [Clostridia bacterium]|nr:ABC transporter permease [Clostridia bacterium]